MSSLANDNAKTLNYLAYKSPELFPDLPNERSKVEVYVYAVYYLIAKLVHSNQSENQLGRTAFELNTLTINHLNECGVDKAVNVGGFLKSRFDYYAEIHSRPHSQNDILRLNSAFYHHPLELEAKTSLNIITIPTLLHNLSTLHEYLNTSLQSLFENNSKQLSKAKLQELLVATLKRHIAERALEKMKGNKKN
jgi:hypothetical protein